MTELTHRQWRHRRARQTRQPTPANNGAAGFSVLEPLVVSVIVVLVMAASAAQLVLPTDGSQPPNSVW